VPELLADPVALEHRPGRHERLPQRRDRRQFGRGAHHCGGQRRPQLGVSVEEDLALVREVTEIGALGHPREGGDVGRSGPAVPALRVELKRRPLKPEAHVLPAATHGISIPSTASH